MANWWAAAFWDSNPMLLVSWVFWVVVSIVLHELGHGWAALRAGDRTPIESGHMTWNPVVHMGVPSLVVFALAGIAWGLMPVDPRRFKRRHDDAVVAGAGPAMNFGLSAVCHVLLAVWVAAAGGYWMGWMTVPERLFDNMQTFLRVGAVLNLVLIALNLLPIPPLDGSRILQSFVPVYGRLWENEGSRIAALVLLMGVIYFGSAPVYGAAFAASDAIVDVLLLVISPDAARAE